jgi:hypothetical protein
MYSYKRDDMKRNFRISDDMKRNVRISDPTGIISAVEIRPENLKSYIMNSVFDMRLADFTPYLPSRKIYVQQDVLYRRIDEGKVAVTEH